MSSVVKLADPQLAVHPVLQTLCDVTWKLVTKTVDVGNLRVPTGENVGIGKKDDW